MYNIGFLYRANAEGLGRKLLLTPSSDPHRAPEKQGTVTASQKLLSLQALSSCLNSGAAKGGCLGRGEALGALRQSVPQNGCVHLHISIDLRRDGILGFWRSFCRSLEPRPCRIFKKSSLRLRNKRRPKGPETPQNLKLGQSFRGGGDKTDHK